MAGGGLSLAQAVSRASRLSIISGCSGTGNPLAFRLPFNPETFNKHSRIELHGRANQSGRLILRLPELPIAHGETQALGELRLVPAP